MNMWRKNILYTSLLFTCHGWASFNNLELREDSVCEGNPQYSQCGNDYPSSWCCKESTTCLQVNSTTATVVLCCPDNNDCATIRPIPCEVSNSSLSPVHILGEPPKLLTCGDSCCPPGFQCDSDICTIEPVLGLIPASLPRPTVHKTFGGGIGVGIGITLAAVAIACLIWMLVQRRGKEVPSLKSMISRPRPIPEGSEGEDEKAALFERPWPSKRKAEDETLGRSYENLAPRSSEMFPPPLMPNHVPKPSTPPPEKRTDERQAVGQMQKNLPPYPSEMRLPQSSGDFKVRQPPAPHQHPAHRTTADTASSTFDGPTYGPGYDQRQDF